MAYRITAFDESWNTEDLTVAEAEAIEAELGCSYLLINPQVIMKHYRVVTTIFLARAMDPDAARQKVEAQTLATMGDVDKVDETLPTIYEDGNPKAVGGPPTDGSSPAPAGSDGPPT